MARIRSIKPGFFTSEDVAELSLRARLTWVGLWCYCDDFGRGKANLKLIKAAVWPLDPVSLEEVQEDLHELAKAGRIVLYVVDGNRFLEVTNWSEHQHPNRPAKASKYPDPVVVWRPPTGGLPTPVPLTEPSVSAHGVLSESATYPQDEPAEPATQRATESSVSAHGALTSGEEGRGEGGEGSAHTREQDPTPEPPRYCSAHPTGTDGPCGACRRARETHDQWVAARTQAAAHQRAETRRAELTQRAHAITACNLCNEHGYRTLEDNRTGGVCNHQPLTPGGLARAQAQLAQEAPMTHPNGDDRRHLSVVEEARA